MSRVSRLACAALALTPHCLAQLFDYDATQPPRFTQTPYTHPQSGVQIAELQYESPRQGQVKAYLVSPAAAKGPFAGIVLQHGGGQTRLHYLSEAIALARSGAVCLITDAPGYWRPEGTPESMRADYAQVAVDVRRGFDLLLARKDVDPKRLAYAGHSFGANAGAILSAIDKRIGYFVMTGGVARLTVHIGESKTGYWTEWRKQQGDAKVRQVLDAVAILDAVNYLGKSAHAQFLVQCGLHDTGATPDDCRGIYETASAKKELRWYSTEHDFHDYQAMTDRVEWLREKLRLAKPR